ncbi:MAG TPA: PilZ domain-containing protein, partial [Candidatus Dormibacteraeota bacterium]|nr:PilZ domain-containing protein [Candidatus Dormibacteraeota bacterium]
RTMEGRKDKRTPRAFRVLLSSGAQPIVAEYGATENVSSYGVRVRTDRPWKPDTRVLVKSWQGDLWARARVVYCQTLQSRNFALGLEFLAHTGNWLAPAA